MPSRPSRLEWQRVGHLVHGVGPVVGMPLAIEGNRLADPQYGHLLAAELGHGRVELVPIAAKIVADDHHQHLVSLAAIGEKLVGRLIHRRERHARRFAFLGEACRRRLSA